MIQITDIHMFLPKIFIFSGQVQSEASKSIIRRVSVKFVIIIMFGRVVVS